MSVKRNKFIVEHLLRDVLSMSVDRECFEMFDSVAFSMQGRIENWLTYGLEINGPATGSELLLALPAEIWIEIGKYLGFRNIVTLSGSSRTFYVIARMMAISLRIPVASTELKMYGKAGCYYADNIIGDDSLSTITVRTKAVEHSGDWPSLIRNDCGCLWILDILKGYHSIFTSTKVVKGMPAVRIYKDVGYHATQVRAAQIRRIHLEFSMINIKYRSRFTISFCPECWRPSSYQAAKKYVIIYNSGCDLCTQEGAVKFDIMKEITRHNWMSMKFFHLFTSSLYAY